MAKIEFDSDRCEGQEAIVVSFDICGFSEFCNHPQAYRLLNKFMAALFDEVHRFLTAADSLPWPRHIPSQKLPSPDFMKYTGDGAIMIWLASDAKSFDEPFRARVVFVMQKLRELLPVVVAKWEAEWGFVGLPKKMRVGIARGTVYPLQGKPGVGFFKVIQDYVGYCINLAVRLQDHCPEAGFTMNASLQPTCFPNLKHCRAIDVKGVREVPVIMFQNDWDSIPPELQRAKFASRST